MAGPENAAKYQTLLFLAGSASAEFFADIGLCPWEAVKVDSWFFLIMQRNFVAFSFLSARSPACTRACSSLLIPAATIDCS